MTRKSIIAASLVTLLGVMGLVYMLMESVSGPSLFLPGSSDPSDEIVVASSSGGGSRTSDTRDVIPALEPARSRIRVVPWPNHLGEITDPVRVVDMTGDEVAIESLGPGLLEASASGEEVFIESDNLEFRPRKLQLRPGSSHEVWAFRSRSGHARVVDSKSGDPVLDVAVFASPETALPGRSQVVFANEQGQLDWGRLQGRSTRYRVWAPGYLEKRIDAGWADALPDEIQLDPSVIELGEVGPLEMIDESGVNLRAGSLVFGRHLVSWELSGSAMGFPFPTDQSVGSILIQMANGFVFAVPVGSTAATFSIPRHRAVPIRVTIDGEETRDYSIRTLYAIHGVSLVSERVTEESEVWVPMEGEFEVRIFRPLEGELRKSARYSENLTLEFDFVSKADDSLELVIASQEGVRVSGTAEVFRSNGTTVRLNVDPSRSTQVADIESIEKIRISSHGFATVDLVPMVGAGSRARTVNIELEEASVIDVFVQGERLEDWNFYVEQPEFTRREVASGWLEAAPFPFKLAMESGRLQCAEVRSGLCYLTAVPNAPQQAHGGDLTLSEQFVAPTGKDAVWNLFPWRLLRLSAVDAESQEPVPGVMIERARQVLSQSQSTGSWEGYVLEDDYLTVRANGYRPARLWCAEIPAQVEWTISLIPSEPVRLKMSGFDDRMVGSKLVLSGAVPLGQGGYATTGWRGSVLISGPEVELALPFDGEYVIPNQLVLPDGTWVPFSPVVWEYRPGSALQLEVKQPDGAD